jgi:hypothetical protein
MKSIPVRAQLGLVAAFYAKVLATAALLVYGRHLQYVHHPEDVVAALTATPFLFAARAHRG